MNKKLVLTILSIFLAIRLVPTVSQIAFNHTLPWAVCISSALTCLIGIYAVFSGIFGKYKLKSVNAYLVAEIICVVFNLAFCLSFYRAELVLSELLVVGNMLTLVVNPVIIYLLRNKKYVKVNY